MRNYAMAVALGGLLALTAAVGFEQLSTQPVAAAAPGQGVQGVHVAQYCAPPYDSPDVRFYCREEVACQGPTGAATFACFM
jgi:hypothetical protein